MNERSSLALGAFCLSESRHIAVEAVGASKVVLLQRWPEVTGDRVGRARRLYSGRLWCRFPRSWSKTDQAHAKRSILQLMAAHRLTRPTLESIPELGTSALQAFWLHGGVVIAKLLADSAPLTATLRWGGERTGMIGTVTGINTPGEAEFHPAEDGRALKGRDRTRIVETTVFLFSQETAAADAEDSSGGSRG